MAELSIGRNGALAPIELPQPLGQLEEAGMSPPRARVNAKDGVSQKYVDLAYVAKECGYPYVVLVSAVVFAWYGGAWLGTNAIRPGVSAVVTAVEEMAKTGTVLAESNKAVMDREIERSNKRDEAEMRMEGILRQLADNVKRLGERLTEQHRGNDL